MSLKGPLWRGEDAQLSKQIEYINTETKSLLFGLLWWRDPEGEGAYAEHVRLKILYSWKHDNMLIYLFTY